MKINYKGFILFIGYGRSGHSAVANLLNRHDNILITDELGIIRKNKLDQKDIIRRIVNNANKQPHYNSLFNNVQFENYNKDKENIYFLGDKHANQTTKTVYKSPEILDRFQNKMKNLKIIHVIRNPYDIITTKYLRKRNTNWKGNINNTINEFNLLANTVSEIKNSYQVYDTYLEDIIYNPDENIKNMINFIGLNCNTDYIEDCKNILLKSPNNSRKKYDGWNEKQINKVQKIINKHNFLHNYNFYN